MRYLASGLATCMPWVAIAGWVLATDTGFDAAGRIDNDPGRASIAILTVAPLLAAIAAGYFALVAWVAGRTGFSLQQVLTVSVVAAVALLSPWSSDAFFFAPMWALSFGLGAFAFSRAALRNAPAESPR